MKFRYKLTLLLIAISLIPLIILPYTLSERTKVEIKKQAEENIETMVNIKSDFYNHIFLDFRNRVEAMAQLIEENWGKGSYYNLSYIYSKNGSYPEEIKNFEFIKQALDIFGKDKNITLIYFVSESGLCFFNNAEFCKKLKEMRERGEAIDPRERPWYKLAKEKNSTVWTPLYIDLNTGKLTTTISTPVFLNGEFFGVAGIDILFETLKEDIIDINFAGNGYALLVEENGNILVSPEYTEGGKKWNETFEEWNIFDISGLKEMGEYVKNFSAGRKIIKINNENYYAFSHPIEEIKGSLIFLIKEDILAQIVAQREIEYISMFFILLIIVIAVAFIFSRSLTKPIEELREVTREAGKGNLDVRAKTKGKDEISELSKDFNRMMEELSIYNKSLRESEEKYRGIFDESMDAIYISTYEGKFVDINNAGLKLLGYTRDEIFKINVEEIYEKREDREKFKREMDKRGFLKNYEVRLKRKDGRIIDCLISAVKIEKDGKIYYQGIIKDITELKEARKMLEMYNSLIRHDIGNRNQIAAGCLELLGESKLKDEDKKLLDKAYENIMQSQKLLYKLSLIGRLGEKELKKISLDNAIEKSIEFHKNVANEKGIKISFKKKNAYVIADELLENVFSNFIENSINHSNCKNIEISIDENNGYYIVRIKDDGKGISEDVAKRIFEFGVKGKESKGSGLGLHLSKIIVEGYGGKIVLKNAKNAEFEIYLKKAANY
ncbi:MAG: PAS domain S-box protein [Thermoplasmatales archaeon]|nr:PAS domain S-box protein [Thermoplasmatales archaeon]